MLHLLDKALEDFLRAAVPLSKQNYDVAFDAPDKQWAASLPKKTTVNIYLRDVRRNSTMRESGMERHDGSGGLVVRQPLPLVDCRYLITVWAASVEYEHSTLGSVLAALLTNSVLPEIHLPPAYRSLRPAPRLQLRGGEGGDDSDFWSALGGQLKPGLDVVVTAPVDAGIVRDMGPPVLDYRLRTRDMDGAAAGERQVPAYDPDTPSPEDVLPGDLLSPSPGVSRSTSASTGRRRSRGKQ